MEHSSDIKETPYPSAFNHFFFSFFPIYNRYHDQLRCELIQPSNNGERQCHVIIIHCSSFKDLNLYTCLDLTAIEYPPAQKTKEKTRKIPHTLSNFSRFTTSLDNRKQVKQKYEKNGKGIWRKCVKLQRGNSVKSRWSSAAYFLTWPKQRRRRNGKMSWDGRLVFTRFSGRYVIWPRGHRRVFVPQTKVQLFCMEVWTFI